MHPGDLAGGFSGLEMTWLLYCAGAATAFNPAIVPFYCSNLRLDGEDGTG